MICEETTREELQHQISAVDDISKLLTESNLDLHLFLGDVVLIVAQQLKVKACTIRLFNRDTEEMELKAVYGLSHEFLDKGRVLASKSLFREVIESGEPSQIYDVHQDPRVQYPKEAVDEGLCSRLTVGLMQSERVLGALSVFTDRPHRFTEYEVQTFQAIGNQIAVAIHLAQLHEERVEIERLEKELAIAGQIQLNLMPNRTPEINRFEFAAGTVPCDDIGGDFFDFINLPEDNLGIAMGDVSGKGIPAALLMATVRTALRVQAEHVYDMREVIGRVNRSLCGDTRPGQFATLFYSVLNAKDRELTYVNAGHNYPILFRKDTVQTLEEGGRPLGLFPDSDYCEGCLQIESGDLLVIYTDGYPEAQDYEEKFFGENRLIQCIQKNRELSAKEILKQIEDDFSAFNGSSGAYCDDRTIVVIKAE